MKVGKIAGELAQLFKDNPEFIEIEIEKILLKYGIVKKEEEHGVYNNGRY